jgi:4-hydroxy-tetrahydrodipicolinate synthase
LTLPLLSIGGKGVVSVLSNLMPKQVVEVCRAWKRVIKRPPGSCIPRLQPITKAMFMEPNPVPVKAALAMKGIIADEEVRLPHLRTQPG